MAIEPVLANLRQELQTISEGSTRQFEEEFAPVHVEWHSSDNNLGRGTFQGDFIGFISFHHEVVLAHQAMRTKNGEPVEDEMRRPRPPYRDSIDTITDPENFSNALEGWHNRVHMNPIYPEDFMDPAVNIFLPLFWQFHTFIDNKFMAWLNNNNIQYDDVDHTVV
jgi:hypothetical protein